jgi:hypothetical protein
MGPDPILSQHLEDQKLAVGHPVLAHWHNWRGRFSARALIVALRPRSVLVELQRATGIYPTGYRLELPRISDSEHWASDHGVQCVKIV